MYSFIYLWQFCCPQNNNIIIIVMLMATLLLLLFLLHPPQHKEVPLKCRCLAHPKRKRHDREWGRFLMYRLPSKDFCVRPSVRLPARPSQTAKQSRAVKNGKWRSFPFHFSFAPTAELSFLFSTSSRIPAVDVYKYPFV